MLWYGDCGFFSVVGLLVERLALRFVVEIVYVRVVRFTCALLEWEGVSFR